MKNNQETESIFGIRPIIEAIQSGKTIDKIFIQKGLLKMDFLLIEKIG